MVQEVKIVISADDDASAKLKGVSAQLDSVGDQAAIASQQIGRVSTATPKMNQSMRMASMQLSQVAQQTMATGNFMGALAIQLPDLALGFGAMGIAAGVAGGVLLQTVGPALWDAIGGAQNLDDALSDAEDALDRVSAATRDASKSLDQLQVEFGGASVAIAGLNTMLRDLEVQTMRNKISDLSRTLERELGLSAAIGSTTILDLQLALRDLGLSADAASKAAGTVQLEFGSMQTALAQDDVEMAGFHAENLARDLLKAAEETGGATDEMIEYIAALREFIALAAQANQVTPLGMTSGTPLSPDGNLLPPALPTKDKRGGGGRRDPIADLERRLERLQEGLLTEEELMIAHYERDQLLLDESLQKKLLLEEEYANASALLAANHAKELADLQKRGKDIEMRNLSSAFGQLEGAFSSHNEKVMGIFGAAQAAIAVASAWSAFAQVLADPSAFTFAEKMARASAILAAGLNAASNVKGAIGAGGAAVSAASGGANAGAAQAAASQAPLEARISGLDPNSIFSGSSITSLFDALQDEAGDRGLSVSFVQ